MNRISTVQKIGVIICASIIMVLLAFHNPFGGYTTFNPDKLDENSVPPSILTEINPQTFRHDEYRRFKSIKNKIEGVEQISGSYSNKAVFNWIDQPSELMGFAIPTIIFGVFWVFIFKKPSNR